MSAASSDNLSGLSVAQTRARRHLSLRWRLVLLVVASVLPLLAFSLGNQYLQYRQEVAATGRQTLALARSMSVVVEDELQARIAALQALTVSRPLQAGDFDGFRAQAETVVAQQFPGMNIVLLKEDGQQFMNTIVPAGAPLPVRPDVKSTRQVFATGQPAVSDLYQAAVGPRSVVAIDVPVKGPGGAVTYALSLVQSLNPRLAVFADVIRRQRVPDSWVVTIFDRRGIVIARVPNGDQFVGREAAPTLLGPLQAEQEGIIETTSLEDIPLLTVFSHAEPFGWAVAIGVPLAELTGPAFMQALRTLAIGGILLTAGLVLALYAARRIAGPIESLGRLAAATDRDILLDPAPTGLREVDEVADALRAAEEERRRSREAEVVLRDGIETIPEGFSIYDAEDRLVMCNESYRRLSAVNPEDLVLGTRYEDFLRTGVARGRYPQAKGHEEEWIAARLREHRDPGGTIEQQLADGSWVLITKRRLSNGWIAGLRVDITALKAAQAALRDSERRFHDIAEVSGDWMWETDDEHRFTLLLGEKTEHAPIPLESLIGRTRWEIAGADPAIDEPWVRHKAEVDAHRPFRYFRYEARTPNGSRTHVSVSGKPVFDQDGGFLGYRGTATDETAIVEARQKTEAAEALLRRVFETSQDLILVTDRQGTFVRVSPSAMPLLGYDPDEMVGRSATEFLYSEDLDNTRDEMRMARRSGMTQSFECRYVHKQGKLVTFWWKGVWSAPAQQHFFVGRDVTALKAAEEALRESEQAARGIIESALDAVIQIDETGVITEWNPQAREIFGWARSEALGRVLNELVIPPGDRARHAAGLARFLATGQSTVIGKRFAVDALRKDGREIKVELAISARHRSGGYVFSGFARDLTQQIVVEGQLRQAQKMEAIGNLTGGMAHDFNNLLGVIVGNLDLARERTGNDAELHEIVGEALEAAWHGSDLTRRLLAFARRQPLRPARVDVNELVADTVRLLRRLLGEDIEIALNLAETVWPVTVDPAQLEASLANLATNARDAMPNGGRLIITTANRRLDADYVAAHADVAEGDFVMIEVSDTGIGMSPEVMGQIFEPFFTTKEPGRGTGLGLSMVFGFLRQSNGHVNVYSEVGAGTTFRLYLPRMMTEALPREVTAAPAIERGTGERVLVVEDNEAVRRVVLRQLRELGYRVFEADRAAAAIELLQHEPVDLVLTDVVMPGGLDGIALARIAAERWPKLKIVLTSGFPQARVESNGDVLGNLQLLSKPYRRSELAAALRTALNR